MLRVVADTNVYISALNFGGVPDQVLALARRGLIAVFVSKPILEEIGDHRLGFLRRARVVVLVRLEPSARRELSVRNTDRILAWLISSPARCPASAFTNSRLSRNLAISMLI